ncbi:hypothetical protein AMAG_00629 [Allomyces macrogynus ATCC 38327]|uniref:Uncharacterized protein n=1 Tax=Allomyces macrogynus (strain ATCC 38327) TaxID=578462 RepID=A0A0L0RWA0_ALLM3|nr:hypothetical protein AMAG_00629 [Allomyces macrogynus ATCC 38327]|eukprot:KNE54672.1 hypothetical protein AMAG_00629 [Allomyces macrogynus ATCC 38327]
MSLYKSALNSSRAAASARSQQQQPSPSAAHAADSSPSSGFTTPTDSFFAPYGGPLLRQPADAGDLASGVRAHVNQFATDTLAATSRPTTPAEYASPSVSKPARRLFPSSRDSSFLASSQDIFLTPRNSGTPNGRAAGSGGPGARLGGIENLAKAGTPSAATKLHPLHLGGSFAGVSVAAAAPAQQQHSRIMGASIEAIMAPFTFANTQRDQRHREDEPVAAPFDQVPAAIPDLAFDVPAGGHDGVNAQTRLRPGDFAAFIPGGGRAHSGDPLAPRPIGHLGGAESASALMINVPASSSDPPANALGADRAVLPHNRSFSALMPTSELYLGPEIGQSPSMTVASKASIMALAPKSPRSGPRLLVPDDDVDMDAAEDLSNKSIMVPVSPTTPLTPSGTPFLAVGLATSDALLSGSRSQVGFGGLPTLESDPVLPQTSGTRPSQGTAAQGAGGIKVSQRSFSVDGAKPGDHIVITLAVAPPSSGSAPSTTIVEPRPSDPFTTSSSFAHPPVSLLSAGYTGTHHKLSPVISPAMPQASMLPNAMPVNLPGAVPLAGYVTGDAVPSLWRDTQESQSVFGSELWDLPKVGQDAVGPRRGMTTSSTATTLSSNSNGAEGLYWSYVPGKPHVGSNGRTSPVTGSTPSDPFSGTSSMSIGLAEMAPPYQIPDTVVDDPLFLRAVLGTAAPPRPARRMAKYNSCSTLHILATTPCRSELAEVVRMIGAAVHAMIMESHRSRQFRTHRLFSEDVFPLSRTTKISHAHTPPTLDMINTYLLSIFEAALLGSEIAIIMLVYLERMLMNTRLTLFSANWARMTLGALLLASKVWDDQAVWNVDYCNIFPDTQVSDFNELERFYIEALHFNVSVKASLYTRYYFALHDRFDSIPTHPLSLRDAIKLEAMSWTVQHKLRDHTPAAANSAATPAPFKITITSGDGGTGGKSPEGMAAPALLPGSTAPPVPSAVAYQHLTGIRRVRSDYWMGGNVPAAIM